MSKDFFYLLLFFYRYLEKKIHQKKKKKTLMLMPAPADNIRKKITWKNQPSKKILSKKKTTIKCSRRGTEQFCEKTQKKKKKKKKKKNYIYLSILGKL
jgi:hypothetical protein